MFLYIFMLLSTAELKRKMAQHEKQQRELKRKSDMFDELIAKRQCIQIESSDDEESWTQQHSPPGIVIPNNNSGSKSSSVSTMMNATPINIVPLLSEAGTSEQTGKLSAVSVAELNVTAAAVSTSCNVTPTAVTASGSSSSINVVKTGRSSRKSNMPVKRTVTPTLLDEASDDDEAEMNKTDTDDADDDYTTVLQSASSNEATANGDAEQKQDESKQNNVDAEGDVNDGGDDDAVKQEQELTNGDIGDDEPSASDVAIASGDDENLPFSPRKTLKPPRNGQSQVEKGSGDGKTNGHSTLDSDSEGSIGIKHVTRVNERSKDKLKMTIRMSAARKTRQSSSRRDSDKASSEDQ